MAKRGKASGASEALVPPAPPPSEREALEASVKSLSGLYVDQLCLRGEINWAGSLPPIFHSSVHAEVHNHFNQERHLVTREVYKQRRAGALAEWRALAA